MNIERSFLETPNEWESVDEDTFLLRTEWAGHYPHGTALRLLQQRGILRTPNYIFRVRGSKVLDKEKRMSKKKYAETEQAGEQDIQENDTLLDQEFGDQVEQDDDELVGGDFDTSEQTEEIDNGDEPFDIRVDDGKAESDEGDAKADEQVTKEAMLLATPLPPVKENDIPKPVKEKKGRGFPLGTIRHYKNGEAFRRVPPPKGWEYLGKTGSEKVQKAEAQAREAGLEVIYDSPEGK